MSDTIRVSLTLTLFLIAFPALYVFFKAADPHLKAIVGAAVVSVLSVAVGGFGVTDSHRLEKD
jgi:hypothetical protein